MISRWFFGQNQQDRPLNFAAMTALIDCRKSKVKRLQPAEIAWVAQKTVQSHRPRRHRREQ